MKYQLLFISIWVINCSYVEMNNSDVVFTHSGHSDIERPSRVDTIIEKIENTEEATKKEEVTKEAREVTESVVFIPNERPVYTRNDNTNVGDIMNNRRIGDLINDVKIETVTSNSRPIASTDSPVTPVRIYNNGVTPYINAIQIPDTPPQDTLFFSGKNNENVEEDGFHKQKQHQELVNISKSSRVKKPILDCTNLDCNNTVNSVCGGKEDERKWKYRLFLNECYFRKVNCGFQYVSNRYSIFPIEKCKTIGAHYTSRPYVFKPIPLPPAPSTAVQNETRRLFSSRRSLNIEVDGSFCGHSCPASCTDDYDPQCALSSSGIRKVFLNHCKLDFNSCLYKIVWYRRPLSECVGGRKADMNQNRGFVGWMQRVGIIDGKGRLVLS